MRITIRPTRQAGLLSLIVLWASVCLASGAEPWLYAMEGTFRQETRYTYHLEFEPESRRFDVTVPLLQDVEQPWYTVTILDQTLTSDVPWQSRYEEADPWGWPNVWSILSWGPGAERIQVERSVRAISEALYGPILSADPFPVEAFRLPMEAYDQLIATSFIQSGDPAIVSEAERLVAGARTELEAVVRILGYVRREIRYACAKDLCDPVLRVDAVATLEKGVGNCVCYANLAIALLRAVGIPAAEANGFVADRDESRASHAWISVYFPSWGWVEFESSDWMPAYREAPVTFLMPQHLTIYVTEGRGISSEAPSEFHEASFEILERPTIQTSLEADVALGGAVAWVITVEIADWEAHTIQLTTEGVPEGWYVSLSEESISFDPENAPSNSVDLLLTAIPGPVATGVFSFDITAQSEGDEKGRITVQVQVDP